MLAMEDFEMSRSSRVSGEVMIAELTDEQVERARKEGAEVFGDLEFEHFEPASEAHSRYWESGPEVATMAHPAAGGGLDEVLDQIRAPKAWAVSRGEGVTIAIIDTGICPTLPDIPANKRSSIDLSSHYQGAHWNDPKGHGSMCAVIAGGSNASGGRFNGVAPDATVLSARTTLLSTDIYRIYEELVLLKRSGQIGPLVASNSYGLYQCSPPAELPDNHPYMEVVLQAIQEGIVVVFAAGNNHWDVLCKHDPAACEPNTIWGANSHDQVLSIGTVNANESNTDTSTPHPNSSRGPGQWAHEFPKPDCVAPTYGEVVWGCGYRYMDWWGTSGACPQVAGLAALMLAQDSSLTPAQVGDRVRTTCRPLNAGWNCVGRGIIDCASALGI